MLELDRIKRGSPTSGNRAPGSFLFDESGGVLKHETCKTKLSLGIINRSQACHDQQSRAGAKWLGVSSLSVYQSAGSLEVMEEDSNQFGSRQAAQL